MRRAFAAMVAVSIVASAAASTRPSEINGFINAPTPYGTASLTWLFLTAYDASLWTDAPAWSMDTTFALTITYRMSFTREELVERTLEEMQRVSPGLQRAALTGFGTSLTKAFQNVDSGDRITALLVPGAPVRFFHNGKPTHQIAGVEFAEAFFGIWLSPRTSDPDVRAGLLRIRS
jgi:hypothetical protein